MHTHNTIQQKYLIQCSFNVQLSDDMLEKQHSAFWGLDDQWTSLPPTQFLLPRGIFYRSIIAHFLLEICYQQSVSFTCSSISYQFADTNVSQAPKIRRVRQTYSDTCCRRLLRFRLCNNLCATFKSYLPQTCHTLSLHVEIVVILNLTGGAWR